MRLKQYKNKEIYCRSCDHRWAAREFVVKQYLKHGGKGFQCPKCGSMDTGIVGVAVKKHKFTLSDAPSEAQLVFIKKLGGNPNRVKSRGEAGAYISALKKLQNKS